jgi:hypothetical protein
MRGTFRAIGLPFMVVGLVGTALGMTVRSMTLVSVSGCFMGIGITFTGASLVRWKGKGGGQA